MLKAQEKFVNNVFSNQFKIPFFFRILGLNEMSPHLPQFWRTLPPCFAAKLQKCNVDEESSIYSIYWHGAIFRWTSPLLNIQDLISFTTRSCEVWNQYCIVLYWFTFSYRSVWMVTTSAACSTPQGGEEEGGLPHPRVVTIRDPSETEGWRRTNRTLLRWWMECRRLTTERPSHLETHTQTHTTTTRSEIRSTHTEATLHKSLEISLALSFSVFVKHMNTHILSAKKSLLPWWGRPEGIWSLLVGSVRVFDCAGPVSPSLEWHMKKKQHFLDKRKRRAHL